jgi:hypothetical protein
MVRAEDIAAPHPPAFQLLIAMAAAIFHREEFSSTAAKKNFPATMADGSRCVIFRRGRERQTQQLAVRIVNDGRYPGRRTPACGGGT